MFLLMFSFVNCILIRDEQQLFVLYFFVFFFFFFQHVNCTFYGTQKIKFSSVCLKLKYLTELKVYFPDIEDQIELVASDEHLCLCDGNVTCCLNSCTLFFFLSNIRAVI